MTSARTVRRPWTAVTALTAGALLTLFACGTGSEEAREPEPVTSEENDASDAGGVPDSGSDEGDETDEGDEGAMSSEGEATDEQGPSDEGSVRMKFAPDLGDSATSGQDGTPTVGAEELGGLLGENLAEDADCDGELVLEEGQSQQCQAPDSIEDGDEATWTAHPVQVPTQESLDQDSQPAVLFTTGDELPGSARQILDEDISLTGAGIGAAFGIEEVPAGELSQSVLSMLTGDDAYVPVDQALPDGATWVDVACEDPLDFETFEAAECTATTSEGGEWQLVVVPGSYIDNDQGLLLGISTADDS